jgi:hypothetical protein
MRAMSWSSLANYGVQVAMFVGVLLLLEWVFGVRVRIERRPRRRK